MSGCSWDSQVEKPVEWLLVGVLERISKCLQSRRVRRESGRRAGLEQFKTPKFYCNKTQNLNLELKAHRSERTWCWWCVLHPQLSLQGCLWLSLIQLLCVSGKLTWLPESPPRPAWLHSTFPCSFREASSTVPQLCVHSFSRKQAR